MLRGAAVPGGFVIGMLACLCLLMACASEPPPSAARPPPPPPPPVEAEPALPPTLNHHQLRGVMNGKADPAVSGCYTVAYSGKEGGTGQLVVDFSVKPDGSVSHASISGSTLNDPTFEECVRKVYEGLVFPKAGGTTDASRPYTFKNGQGDTDTAAATEQ